MKRYELLPGVEAVGLSLYVPSAKTLVVADIHLGYEEEFKSMGFMLPRFQYKEVVSYLGEVFGFLGSKGVECVVVNGDLKHEFCGISRQVRREVNDLLDFLFSFCGCVVLVRGNHDSMLASIVEGKGVELVDYFFLPEEKIYFCHGHKVGGDSFLGVSKTVVVAHTHPAVSVGSSVRTEKVKCFLVGLWNNKNLVAMPSLTFVSEGTPVSSLGGFSPFLGGDLGDFRVFGVEGFDVLDFGKLSVVEDFFGKK